MPPRPVRPAAWTASRRRCVVWPGIHGPEEATIIKIVTFLAPPFGTTAAAFQAQWRDGHAPLARDLPGLRGHLLNIPLETHSRADVAQLGIDPFDGIEELWFDDQAAYTAAMASPAGARWQAEAARIIGARRGFITREVWEVPIRADRRPGMKSFTAIRRRDDATPQAFQYAWRMIHGPMAATVPLLRGFVLSGIIAEQPQDGIPALPMELPLDGIAESWCDDLDARRAMVVSAEAKRWFADGATFLGRVKTVLLREEIMIPPPVG